MIAMSYVKMSSCPSVPTSRVEIPLSDTQQAELSVDEEDSRWKVDADVCAFVITPLFFSFVFLPLHILLINLSIFLSLSTQNLLPSAILPVVPVLFHFSLCYSLWCSFMSLSFCFLLLSVHLSFILACSIPLPITSSLALSLFSFCLTVSSFLPGLNHRAWWPWEWPGPGPQEQDLLQVRPPEEGGQRPSAPWRWRLPGGLEECCGLCRQSLCQGALSQWSLHRTSWSTR